MKAVFLDRDGTIGGTGGGMHPFEFTMYETAPQSIRQLNEIGINVFLFTNQTRVGRGYFSEENLIKGFELMKSDLARQGAHLDDIFYCPHKPEDGCECQKPRIGLLLAAKEKYDLNLEECYIVGDTGSSDMVAASRVGAKKVLVETGWGKTSLTKYRKSWENVEADYIATDLVDAVQWILNDSEKDQSSMKRK